MIFNQIIRNYKRFGFINPMLILRKVTPYENLTLGAENWTQLAVELTDSGMIPEVIEMLKKEVIGLHLHVDEGNIIYDSNEKIIVKNEKELSKLSLEDGTKYCYAHKPKDEERLADISYYYNKLILNVCHICADGRFLTKQLENIVNISKYNFKKDPQKLLTPFEVCFKDQLSRIQGTNENIHFDPKISHILTKDHCKKHDNYYHYDSVTFPARQLKVYDRQTKKISGFNEELLTGFILTSLVFSNSINNHKTDWFKSFGTCTCIDLKDKIERNADTVCNAYGQINVIASVNESTTIEETNKLIKKDILIKKAGNSAFLINNVAKQNFNNNKNKVINLPGRRIDMSNVGPIYIKKPVSDLWIGHGQKNNCKGAFYSYSFSVIDKEIDRNDLSIVFRHDNKEMNSQDANLFASAMKHFLTSIPLKTSLGDAFKELTKFIKQ